MHVYKRTEPNLWTVGFYDPQGLWYPESDHPTEKEAANRAIILNGGEVESKTTKAVLFYYDAKHEQMLNELNLGELTDSELELANKIILWLYEVKAIDGRYKALEVAQNWEYQYDNGDQVIVFDYGE